MIGRLRRLFKRADKTPIETCSSEELRHIIEESEWLTDAVQALEGPMPEEDLKRMSRLTKFLNEVSERARNK